MNSEQRNELIARYCQGPDAVEAALVGITEAEWDARPEGGGWTAREIVHHLADSEITSAIRLRRLVAEDAPEIQGYNEELFAQRLYYDKRPVAGALAALRVARETTAELLTHLDEADWTREGTHSESGRYSVETWLEIYAAHAHDHAEQLRRARATGATSSPSTSPGTTVAPPDVALTPGQIARTARALPDMLAALTASLPAELARWRPEGEPWSLHDIIGHLIEADRYGIEDRIRRILAGTDAPPAIPFWDQEAAATARSDSERTLDSLLDELRSTRASLCTLVERLTPADLLRTGAHATAGPISAGDLVQEWLYHDQDHLRQALSLLQAKVWPFMGATQRFYED